MKSNSFFIAVAAVALLIAGCGKKEAAPAEEKKSAESESRVKRGTNGEVIITLDAETQKRVGLESVTLTTTQFAPEIKAVGRVLDPAGVSSLVADFISARAAADASGKELERAKTLVKTDNVSMRALQAAEANAARDTAQLEAARAKLIGALGKEFAERENLVEWVKSLSSGASVLVRLELMPGEPLPSQLAGARLVSLNEANKPVETKFVGTTAVDAQSQTHGLLFFVESNSSALVAGEAVTGFIKVPGNQESGVVVPRNAVLRKDGAPWVYVQTSGNEFARREVST
ncbi:MAG: hypothetical protein EPO07_08405, partial [Verrucomicrobia bacterium]